MDIKKYASFHRALIENYKTEQAELNNKTYNSLQNITNILKNKPNVTRAILFGSLLNGTYTIGSDVDIAIEGIPPSDFFSTWREIEGELGIKIDLVDYNPDNIPIYNIIKKTGKVIYEKSK